MIDVILEHTREVDATSAALAVNQAKPLTKFPGTWRGVVSPAEYDQSRIDSFRAETALAQVLGLPHTWEVFKDGKGDGKVDLVLPTAIEVDGVVCKTIQVKWRGERCRDLATAGLDFHAELVCDLYVLAWPTVDGTGVTLVGWCTKHDFINRVHARPPVRMLGRKWEMIWSRELRPMQELVDLVTTKEAAQDVA